MHYPTFFRGCEMLLGWLRWFSRLRTVQKKWKKKSVAINQYSLMTSAAKVSEIGKKCKKASSGHSGLIAHHCPGSLWAAPACPEGDLATATAPHSSVAQGDITKQREAQTLLKLLD